MTGRERSGAGDTTGRERKRSGSPAGGRGATLAVALAALVVLSGCSTLGFQQSRGDPGDDTLGWEDGHWYDDSLAVTTDDGLNESERRAVVARTMARVERIRGLEFEDRVPVEVITRTEYRERRGNRTSTGDPTFEAWNNQVWEALFLVGEDRSVSQTFDEVFGSSVQGFYSPGRDEIVIVSDSETPTLDRRTLSHELVHALQDQHLSLSAAGGADTQDAQLAEDGLVEGDANAVEQAYEARCGAEWQCIERPERAGGSGGGSGTFDFGVFLTIYTPYASGPGFVSALRDRGGWDAVDDAYDEFPTTTEQVIHPEKYPDEGAVDVTVPDRSSADWERFDLDPVADRVGEGSIYAMFWANGAVDRNRSPYNYSHPLSAGWAGDAVVPYRDDGRYGYVWRVRWDTEADARAFAGAYRDVLQSHGATRDGNVWIVPDSDPFGDAFRVTRRGNTVTIVNAPTRDALEDVHAGR